MMSQLRTLFSLSIVGILLATTLVASTSSQAAATSSLTTCTNLETGKTLVLRIADAKCRTHLGSALWVQERPDTPFRTGGGYATMTVCSSKNSRYTYRLIQDSCPKFQVSTNYWRTVAAPTTPVIEAASARGHDSATLSITPSTAAPSAQVLYYLVTDIKSGLVKKVTPGNFGHLSILGLSSESTYTFSIAAVNVDGTSEASLATPSIRTSAAPVVASSSQVAISCANGGTCVVGDRGPGGGIVYYASAAPFASAGSICDTACKYLEVAPASWQSAGVSVANDATYEWSNDTNLSTGQDRTTASSEGISAYSAHEKFNWKIGQGFYNTSVMKVAGATSAVQARVLAYAGTSVAGQWFLPSMNELNELCKYARGQSTGNPTVACVTGSGTFKSTANVSSDLGGFVEGSYWSSSESHPTSAWFYSFTNGVRSSSNKSAVPLHVRPVRAF